MAVTVQGRVLPGGMLYVGTHMPAAASGWKHGVCSPCLVNPAARAAPPGAGAADQGGWAVDYAALTPSARGSYLDWLAAGRSDRTAPRSFVMLFLSGIERRLLVDGPPADERDALRAELVRLQGAYAHDSLVAYSTAALVRESRWRELLARPGWLQGYVPDLAADCADMSVPIRIAAGTRIAAGEALDFEMAMGVILAAGPAAGGLRQRIGAHRTRAAFIELMRVRFARKFPDGFKLRDKAGSVLSIPYHAFSHHLEIPPITTAARIPDPADLTWTRLLNVCDAAMEDLGPYARLVKEDWSGASSAEAAAALPADLYKTRYGPLQAVAGWLDTQPALLALEPLELWTRVDGSGSPVGSRGLKAAASVLAGLGYGMEPDPALGWTSPPADGALRIYRASGVAGIREEPGALYAAARFALLVASSAAPGNCGPLRDSVGHPLLPLPAHEILRLSALADGLGAAPPTKRLMARAAAAIRPEDRPAAAALLLEVTSNLEIGAARRIACLELAFEQLGQDCSAIYAAYHRMPATLQAASGREHPGVPGSQQPPDTLDAALIARIRSETDSVQTLLAQVYEEPDEPLEARLQAVPASKPASSSAGTAPRFGGLDSQHEALVQAMALRAEWTRREYEDLARSLGLMPDGAMETVNDWAYDRYGDALLEDGNPVLVDRSLLE